MKTETNRMIEVSAESMDQLQTHQSYAQTYAHMLYDLLLEDDGSSTELSINDPAHRTQRMFACLESIQERLKAISGVLPYGANVPAA